MKTNNNTSSAAKRVLRVWIALKGHYITGLSNSEICKLLGDSAPNVTRALNTLIEEDLVTKLPTGRFSHSIKTLQIAAAHYDHIQRTKQRIHDSEASIAAGAYI